MNRRAFLKYSSAAASVSMLSPLVSRVASARGELKKPDRFFVQIQMGGGWDTTLGLDPWLTEPLPPKEDIFIEYVTADGGLDRSKLFGSPSLTVGPAMEPMVPYLNRTAVVNGVFMSTMDNGHGASMSYINTGSPIDSNPDVVVEINQSILDSAFGVAANTAVQTKSRAQIVTPLAEFQGLGALPNPGARVRNIVQTIKTRSDLFQALVALAESAPVTDSLVAALDEIKKKNAQLDMANVVAATFLTGACTTAMIDFSSDVQGFLDTHSNHVGQHLQFQTGHWNKVAEMLKIFAETPFGSGGESLLDRTTFYVSSEFTRTPALNASGGKDHNPYTNSICLIGAGVRGNQVVGKSKVIPKAESKFGFPYLVAMPFDFNKCEAVDSRDNSSIIFPENVIRTIAEIMQVDWGSFHSVPKSTPYLTKLVL